MLYKEVEKTRRKPWAQVVPAVLGFLLLFFPPVALGVQSVTLAWDPSPGADISGYNIYCGAASSSYTNKLSLGNVTNATITTLVEGVTYYFAATAMNTSGLESDPSNEVSYTVPTGGTPGNKPPTIFLIPNLTINESASEQTIPLSGITSGASNEVQTLTVTASSSNPALIPDPEVTYTSPGTTGILKFTPVMYAYGSASITVQVNDAQPTNNIATQTFAVTVVPVNQPPTLSVLSPVSISENAGEQTVNLSGITSGAPNEAQTLSVTATSSNPALIPNPTVTYTSPNSGGTLKFTPVMYAYGSATISVQVNDGAPSNNIVNRTFAVTVVPVNQAPTLNPIADVVLPITTTSQTLSLSGISSGATNETQALTVTAISDNPALIPNPALSYTSPNATGTLTLLPMNKAEGVATITVTVSDGQAVNATFSRSFMVRVVDGNQAPTLDPLPDLVVQRNASVQRVNLGGITSGAPFETQNLSVTALSSDTALIPNPTVSYVSPNTTGLLSFRPVPSRTGTANITVTVNDGGASDNIITRVFAVNVTTTVSPQLTANPTNQVIVAPAGFTLVAAATGTSPQYQWFKNSTAIAGATASSFSVAQSHRASAGQYSITVSNSAGSVSSPSATVRVLVPQQLSPPEPQPDGSVLLSSRDVDGGSLAGADAAKFELQWSIDLMNWAPVVGSVSVVDGSLRLQDPAAATAAVRYHRVVEKP